MLPRRRPTCRTLAAPLRQRRSRLSQPWQTCACLQKWVAHLRLSLCRNSTACKVPCRRARSHQRNAIMRTRDPFSPAGTECSYNRLNRQAPGSPAPTEYPYNRQTSRSPASTTCDYGAVDAPLPEFNGGQGLAGGFNPKFPPGAPTRPDDLLHEDSHCPFGVPPPDDSTALYPCRKEVGEHYLENCSSQWCGLFSSCRLVPQVSLHFVFLGTRSR